MKKLLVLMLVLGMASVSQAAWTGFVVDGYGSTYNGPLGVTIRIDLVADTDWSSTVWGGIVEASAVDANGQALAADVVDMGGAVGSDVIYTSAAVNILDSGFQINYLGNLAVTAAAATSAGALSPGTVTVSFDYTLPSSAGAEWYVAPLIDGETFTYNGGLVVGATYSNLAAVNVPIEGLLIVPEPMTVLLLGLGGLFLRRRK